MRFMLVPVIVATLMAAGCSESSEDAASESLSIAESAPQDGPTANGNNETALDPLKVNDSGNAQAAHAIGRPPQIAYVYEFGFRLNGKMIAPLQQRHADLCESKGLNVCRIISMEQTGSEGDYVQGALQLAVKADLARAFGKDLARVAERADGEQTSSSITGEDLSKQIVDTQARLRARTVLRDRLLEVLATRKGTVKELIEAERGVAQVNEEIDQATSWLAEMSGRVAYSRLNLSYESGSPSSGGFIEPIRAAIGSIGAILGMIAAALIVIATIGVPLILLAFALRLGWAKVGAFVRRQLGTPEHEATAKGD